MNLENCAFLWFVLYNILPCLTDINYLGNCKYSKSLPYNRPRRPRGGVEV
jgi:hypothetical protein